MTTIRELSPDEWSLYKEIRLEALKDSPQAFTDTFEKSSQKPDEEWRSDLVRVAHGEFLLHFAISDSVPVGLLGAYQREPGIWIMYSMFVKKSHRGQKIGKMLVEALIEKLKKRPDVKKIRLDVNPDQVAALAMYTKLGFKTIKVVDEEVNGLIEREYLMELSEE